MNLTGSLKVVCGDYLNFLNMKICERFLNFGAGGAVAFYSLLFYQQDVSSTTGRPDTEFDIQLDIWLNIRSKTGYPASDDQPETGYPASDDQPETGYPTSDIRIYVGAGKPV